MAYNAGNKILHRYMSRKKNSISRGLGKNFTQIKSPISPPPPPTHHPQKSKSNGRLLTDVIGENQFHNCTQESGNALLASYFSSSVLKGIALETLLNNTVNRKTHT